MRGLIAACFGHTRAVLLALVFVVAAGAVAYRQIPKEADPDIQLPTVYISVLYEGISPEDSERLLVRPIESEVRAIEGIKEMRSTASEGFAAVVLEFDVGTDIDQALIEVREKVDIAKAELPDGAEEPRVQEVNFALFPVLVVTLSGNVPERTLLRLARQLEDDLEGLSNVLDVEIAGERDELLEIIIDPLQLESYGLEQQALLETVARNNRLVAAGSLDTGQGRFAVKVPGVFETADDLLNLPLKAEGDRVVRLRDVGTVRRTFKDAEGYARVGGQPSLALEVKKRVGTNVIDTIEEVKALVERERQAWPSTVQVAYTQDKSDVIRTMLADLEGNVVAAVVLVLVLMIATMGVRPSLLVAVAVPGSFLAGFLALAAMGLTVNIVVLFALILTSGMVIDGAIIVVEYADRKMAEGVPRREAYLQAAQRMVTPVISGNTTAFAAFLPLLFWPGVVGEFMVYLPITVLATLVASILFAIFFVPVIGSFIGAPGATDPSEQRQLAIADDGDLRELRGVTGLYVRLLRLCLRFPGLVTGLAVALLLGSWMTYATLGKGVEFFPDVEPDLAQIQIHARGDLAVAERDALTRQVEQRILGLAGVKTVYSRTALAFREGRDVDEDVVGIVLLEFTDWETRRPATEIMEQIRSRTIEIPGVWIEVKKEEHGPPVGKPVQLEIGSRDQDKLELATEKVRAFFDQLPGLRDVADSRPIPGIEWRVIVDREQAGRFGADITTVGTQVQLVTNGVMLGEYRPDDSVDEIDIRARFGEAGRHLEELKRLRVNTSYGSVPTSNFVKLVPEPRVGNIKRTDGRRVFTVSAEIESGVLADDKVQELRTWLARQSWDPEIGFIFRGEDEEQKEASAFLTKAFAAAVFLILIVLVLQFDSFYQSFLVLTAIIFSTIGALLSLLITGQPFGIVMCGIGLIALAGTIVNNNIVLIDTYNELRARGMDAVEASLRTGALRLRPVFLTAINGVVGLMPMVLRLNVDFIAGRVTAGGPSTDWWVQLSTVIAGGLTFATLITLILTPCLLVMAAKVGAWRIRRGGYRQRHRGSGGVAAQPAE